MEDKNDSLIVPQIQWYDGMALSPHHFQQTDLRNHQVLSYHINLLSFFHWGAQNIEIDRTALPDGTFRLLCAEIIMPDGLVYNYNSETDQNNNLEIDLNKNKPESSGEILTINIVVPKIMSKVSSVCSATPRFSSVDWSPVNDENTDDNPLIAQRLIPKLSLQIGEVLPINHTGFPIAKIKFEENAFKLIEYTQPCFKLEKTSHLGIACAQTAQKIREKAHSLSEKWQNQIGTSLIRESAEVLRPIIAALPPIESILNSPTISPFFLYSELVRTAGIIAQLHLSAVPPKFSPYNQNNIDDCIIPILSYISECIDRVSLDYSIFAFKKNDNIFSLNLNSAYFFDSGELLIGVRSRQGVPTKQTEFWVNDAIIASDAAIQIVQVKRVTGAPRKLVTEEKLYDISPPRDVTLFSISIDEQFVLENQYLHIFNPSDSAENRPLDILLYVSKDSNKNDQTKAA